MYNTDTLQMYYRYITEASNKEGAEHLRGLCIVNKKGSETFFQVS